jgi:hypothetical protein
MFALVPQLIAFAMAALFVYRVALPALRETRDSDYLPYAKAAMRRGSYIPWFVALSLIATISQGWFSYAWGGNVDSAAAGLVMIAGIASLVILLVVFRWVMWFFQRGSEGLFPELVQAARPVQDVARPFLWTLAKLFIIVDLVAACLNAVLAVASWRLGQWAIDTLTSISGSVLILSFLFNVAVRRFGTGRIIINALGVMIILSVASYAVDWLITKGLGLDPNATMSSSAGGATAIVTIATAWYLYHRFNTAEPDVWLPGDERR